MPLERLRSRRWDGVGPGVNKLFTVAKPRYPKAFTVKLRGRNPFYCKISNFTVKLATVNLTPRTLAI